MMEWHLRIEWQEADKIDWRVEAEKLIDAYRIMGDEYDVPAQAAKPGEPVPFTVFRLVNHEGVFAAVEYGNYDFGLWGAGRLNVNALAADLQATWDAFEE